MKTTALVFFGILLCLPGYVTAQDEEKTVATNELRTGTLHILFSEFYLDYEKLINQNGFMIYGAVDDSKINTDEKFGLQGGLQYRRYHMTPADEKYYNWYTGLLAGYGYKTKKESDNSSTVNYMRAGIILGLKIFIIDNIVLDLSWAHVYQYSMVSNSSDYALFGSGYTGIGYSGFRPQVNCTVGIRF